MRVNAAIGKGLLLVLAVSLMFRLSVSLVTRMNLDEAWHYYLVRQPVSQWWGNLAKDRHPPLYDICLGALLRIGIEGEKSLRMVMVVSSCLAVCLVFLLGKELVDERVALGGAFFYSITFMAWEYDTWLRGQAWLNLLALLSTWLLWRALRENKLLYWVSYGVASGLLLATHYLGFLVLGCHFVFCLITRSLERRIISAWIVCGLVYSPCIPLQWEQYTIRAGKDLSGSGSLRIAVQSVLDFMGTETGLFGMERLTRGYIAGLPWSLGLSIVGCIVIGGALMAIEGNQRTLLLIGLVLPVMLYWTAIALKTPELYRPRYFALVLPYVGLLWATAVYKSARPVSMLAIAGLALMSVVNLWMLYDYVSTGYFKYMDWSPISRWISSRQHKARLVAVTPSDPLFALAYYYAGDAMQYIISDPWHTRLAFSKAFLARGGLPLVRVNTVSDIEQKLRGVNRIFVVFWMSGPTSVRAYFRQKFGVIEGMRIDNYQPDGRAEVYLMERYK